MGASRSQQHPQQPQQYEISDNIQIPTSNTLIQYYDQQNNTLGPTRQYTFPVPRKNSSHTLILHQNEHENNALEGQSLIRPAEPIIISNEMPQQLIRERQIGGIGRGPLNVDNDTDRYRKRKNILDDERSPRVSDTARIQMVNRRSPRNRKVDEIHEYKTQRSMLQNVQDMEDRIFHDSRKTQKLANNLKQRSSVYTEIMMEYEKLQAQERALLRDMFTLQSQPSTGDNDGETDEHQKEQLRSLQRKNAELEKERRIIQEKLEELISTNRSNGPLSTHHTPYRLLRELQDQENLNENALNSLRTKIYTDRPLSPAQMTSLPMLYGANKRYSRLRENFGDDIRAFRNDYLKTGGHNSAFLAHYTDLEYKIRTFENSDWMRDNPEPLTPYRHRYTDEMDDRLRRFNAENKRLQNDINLLQKKFRNLNTNIHTHSHEYSFREPVTPYVSKDHIHHHHHHYTRNPVSLPLISPRSSSYDDHYYHDPRPPTTTNIRTEQPLHLEQDSQFKTRTAIRASPGMSLLLSNMNKLKDPLEPSPYDPVGGFVIFFDFILNLDPSVELCRLVTCLHHPKSGLGEPSQLQSFTCDPFIDQNGQKMSVVLIATKQPVPRCPPQQALTIIIEVQTSNQKSDNAPLQTKSWTKIPLFDHKNRLLSGRWKVPLRSLPILYDATLGIINTFPTAGTMELHYRLVNYKDADEQTNAPLSPTFKDLYAYVPQSEDDSQEYVHLPNTVKS
ncbi:unnamed protein product [Didymodactylos carnosus]|uniref:Uncharacterized protein n=1 Tax=Didymodactylos carnosus TaxID=1234261 RepID=A0A813PH54_9BILA|nr:unnamed protein product [Didymodactylos carnosus]CAF0776433.1 unnamed protein product [Didymodactylos carnosus]CAF3534175.1 unnamed protein product [Didymodactylos carnosus]CAF3557668.1 unnamed protein product [Didymodactylos carnosus]